MPRAIKKAVFPVGGLGTRFLPATKSMPKEMLTVVDRPLIHYAVDQARAAGIEEFIFVTGRNKSAIEDYFDKAFELEYTLENKKKKDLLELAQSCTPPSGNIAYIRQGEPLGLGHSIYCARHFIGDEAFAVILPDELFLSAKPFMKQMVNQYKKVGGNVLGVADVPHQDVSKYGIIDPASDDGKIIKIKGMVEKPSPKKAPSTISITGQYILQPEIFNYLESNIKKGKKGAGEFQLTDAMAAMIGKFPSHGVRFKGKRYDCGNRRGFLKANIAFALEMPEIKDEVLSMMKEFVEYYDQ